MTWVDIDFGTETVSVNKTLQRVGKEYLLLEPKTDRSRRTLPLPQSGAGALKTHRTAQLEERLRLGSNWQDRLGLVFTTKLGAPLHASVVTHTFWRFLDRAGLPRIRFHDLRHTTATLLLANGTDARVIMDQLGHSQFSLTMNTYTHVMPHKLRQR